MDKHTTCNASFCLLFIWQTLSCASDACCSQPFLNIPAPPAHYTTRIDTTGTSIAPSILILHYTAVSLAETLSIFMGYGEKPSSSHFTVSKDGHIFQHVAEDHAARHAGQDKYSFWNGVYDLNYSSLGIEQVHAGYRQNPSMPLGIIIPGSPYEWYYYDQRQSQIVIELCTYLITKYQIEPRCVLGHSDVAPGRKTDPGPLFPWRQLAEAGIGAWPDWQKYQQLPCLIAAHTDNTLEDWLIKHLHIWGYRLPDETATAHDIIQAFQMHFRATDITGSADDETAQICAALICTYILSESATCPCCEVVCNRVDSDDSCNDAIN